MELFFHTFLPRSSMELTFHVELERLGGVPEEDLCDGLINYDARQPM
jgi:hypothetical protein